MTICETKSVSIESESEAEGEGTYMRAFLIPVHTHQQDTHLLMPIHPQHLHKRHRTRSFEHPILGVVVRETVHGALPPVLLRRADRVPAPIQARNRRQPNAWSTGNELEDDFRVFLRRVRPSPKSSLGVDPTELVDVRSPFAYGHILVFELLDELLRLSVMDIQSIAYQRV